MSMGWPGGSTTALFPYWPTTRIERPLEVVTAPIVSDVARPPGSCSVATCLGWAGSCTSTTAAPPPGGGVARNPGVSGLESHARASKATPPVKKPVIATNATILRRDDPMSVPRSRGRDIAPVAAGYSARTGRTPLGCRSSSGVRRGAARHVAERDVAIERALARHAEHPL